MKVMTQIQWIESVSAGLAELRNKEIEKDENGQLVFDEKDGIRVKKYIDEREDGTAFLVSPMGFAKVLKNITADYAPSTKWKDIYNEKNNS